MLSTRNTARILSVFVTLAMLFSFANVSSALAAPQREVRGHGKVQLGDATVSVSQISVNAWEDENGVHGTLVWTGGVTPVVPTAYPWQMDVTSITFSASNTAEVCWVVTHSVVPGDIGFEDCFVFTDNRATGAPDTISGVAIQAGNIIVR